MAIGSNILYVDSKTGKVHEVYNHMSSHPMYTGRVLYEHYKTEDSVKDLVSHGDIFCLGYSTQPIPEDKKDDVAYNCGNNHCSFFARDNIELNQYGLHPKKETRTYEDMYRAIDELNKKPNQFTYIFKDGKWHFRFWKRRVEEMTPVLIFHDDEEDG